MAEWEGLGVSALAAGGAGWRFVILSNWGFGMRQVVSESEK